MKLYKHYNQLPGHVADFFCMETKRGKSLVFVSFSLCNFFKLTLYYGIKYWLLGLCVCVCVSVVRLRDFYSGSFAISGIRAERICFSSSLAPSPT